MAPAATASRRPPSFNDQEHRRRRHCDGLLQCAAGRHAVLQAAGRSLHAQRQLSPAGDGRHRAGQHHCGVRGRDLVHRRQGQPPRHHQPIRSKIRIRRPAPTTGTRRTAIPAASYSMCADTNQPGVGSVVSYLQSLSTKITSELRAHSLLSAEQLQSRILRQWHGGDATADPFTIPPSPTPSIGDVLLAAQVSFHWYGEGSNQYVDNPNDPNQCLLQHLQSVPVPDFDHDQRGAAHLGATRTPRISTPTFRTAFCRPSRS